jgi:hypothetical protein
MLNLGHTVNCAQLCAPDLTSYKDSVTVIDESTQGFTETDIRNHITVYFVEGEGLPNL